MFSIPNAFPNNLSSSQEDPTPDPKKPLVFVNYYPLSMSLQQQEPKESQIKEIESAIESKIKFIVKSFLDQEQQPLNIIPKKGNLDLKKFLNKRLERLNKRTEKAINKLLRQKYNEANGIKEDEQGEEKKDGQKGLEKKEQEVKFNPLYNREQTYDSEMYDEDEIAENEYIRTDGNALVEALATQDKLYQKMDDSDSD